MVLDFSKWLGAIKVFFGGKKKKKGLVLTATREALAKSRRTETRARNKKGHFIADDKSTPDINESYVKPKKSKSKPPKKKTSKPKTLRSRGRKK